MTTTLVVVQWHIFIFTKTKDDAMDTVTPSKTTTTGQIDKAVANYRAMLEKHANEFNSEVVQTVLGQPELATEQLAVFRKRVEAISDLIVRKVTVDRTRTPKKVLDATGRTQYTTDSVVKAMPKGEGDEVEVVFFKLGRNISDNDLDKEYELRGLIPADPYSLAAVNEADPAFADEHPNGTHWKESGNNWCFAAFNRWSDFRRVYVNRFDGVWIGHWFFAGLRKKN